MRWPYLKAAAVFTPTLLFGGNSGIIGRVKIKVKYQLQGSPPRARDSRVVLVGTYRGDQFAKWRGWYNYPISDGDFSRVEHAERVDGKKGNGRSRPPNTPLACVNELWLFNGTKEERRYRAEFVGIKTREELIRDYGYLAWENSRGDAESRRENSTRSTRPNNAAKPHGGFR